MIHPLQASRSRLALVVLGGLVIGACALDEGGWPGEMERGIVFAAWTPNGYGSTEAAASLLELSGTGASHVAVVVTGYVDSLEDSTVEAHPNRTPSFESVRATLAEARRLGLQTALKPHVDVLGGEYRGSLAPEDPGLWFETYEAFLLPWAELAEEEGCASFSVGTELASMTGHRARWAELVRAVRRVFSGHLLYGANWTDIESDDTEALYRLVDAAGVDAYFPIADAATPTVTDMVVAWQPWLGALEDLERRTGRPVLVTEVGCMSREYGAVSPWVYDGSDAIDPSVQAHYYEATLRALATCPAVRGVFFWAWGIAPAGPEDGSHSPRGKPAADVLRTFWSPPGGA